MATQTRSPGAFANGNIWGTGSFEWNDLANMVASDDNYATVTQSGGAMYSHVAMCTEFGFTIPATAIISKVEVHIEAKRDITFSHLPMLDWCVLLYSGGTSLHMAAGNDNQDSDPDQPLTASDEVYKLSPVRMGDPDLWGMAWTPAMVNDEAFGVGFDAWLAPGGTVSVDHVEITVTYTVPDPEEEETETKCDLLPCGKGFESLADAIKSTLAKYTDTDCGGLKVTAVVANCNDLTSLVGCGDKYTLEQAFKAALKDDGCGNAVLNLFIIPQINVGR